MRGMMRFALLPWFVACSDPAPETETPPTPGDPLCGAEGSTFRAFVDDGVFGVERRDLAADFTLPTHQGDWTFSAEQRGCDTVMFVPDSLVVSPLDATPLVEKRRDLRTLLESGPRNVHWFFVTTGGGVQGFVDGMVGRIEGVLELLPAELADHWRSRAHVVTERADRLDSWIPDALAVTGRGFGIDRFQRIRHFGNLADVTRFSPELQAAGAWSWEDNLAYLGHEVQYYNYESDRQDAMDAVDWTSVYLHYDEDLASTGRTDVDVELPDAATMATFDTLLVELQHTCDPTRDEFGNCDAWDAIQTIFACEADDPTSCGDLELARYITTYHREGRWLADASPMLPMIREGGKRRFHLRGPRGGHFVSARLLLANRGQATKPFAITPLWEGGSFDETYDESHPPMTIDVPADATGADLVVVLSGHGFGNGPNCAEFCDHQHTFTIGGQSWTADHPNMGDQEGCLEQIDQGTVPNQSGTWWFERSSWCPGKQVDPWVFDISDRIVPGQPLEIDYDTNQGEGVFGGSILMRSWVSFRQ